MCLARDVSIQRLLSTHTLLPAATAALLTEPGAGDGLRDEEKLISSEIPSFLGSAGSEVPAQQGPGCPHCHLAVPIVTWLGLSPGPGRSCGDTNPCVILSSSPCSLPQESLSAAGTPSLT